MELCFQTPAAAPVTARKKSTPAKPATPPPSRATSQDSKAKGKAAPVRPTRSTSQDVTKLSPGIAPDLSEVLHEKDHNLQWVQVSFNNSSKTKKGFWLQQNKHFCNLWGKNKNSIQFCTIFAVSLAFFPSWHPCQDSIPAKDCLHYSTWVCWVWTCLLPFGPAVVCGKL